jgi:hypothetical protein
MPVKIVSKDGTVGTVSDAGAEVLLLGTGLSDAVDSVHVICLGGLARSRMVAW